jgi:ADP-ribosylglycohydrolase
MIPSSRIASSIFASIAGDALGVPVESSTRQQLALSSVKNMLGYGRYDQPEGTWSDDSSMILCTMEALCDGYKLGAIADLFCKWLFEGYWTPEGYAFDVGLSTFQALESIKNDGAAPTASGRGGEDDNGNGSLMRILPAALYFSGQSIEDMLAAIHEIASITHSHPRAQIGCGIYSLLIRNIIETGDKNSAYKKAMSEALTYYEPLPLFTTELKHFIRLFSYQLPNLRVEDIQSSGYVVHTLEAAVWSFMRNTDTMSCLLEAVNLGLDTDTTGTVAGGLAGLLYGTASLPDAWLNALARKSDIETLTSRFSSIVQSRHSTGFTS